VTLPVWTVALLGLAALLLLVFSAVWLFNAVRGLASDIDVTAPDLSGLEVSSAESAQPSTGESAVLPDPSISRSTPTPAPILSLDTFQSWKGTERVNVLLLGIDLRCDEDGPTRTDSMMVVSIDPVGKAISALSLPRDTWVELPGFGMDSINDAHFQGEINEYPGGGTGLAMDTVSNFLGIKVDHFVTINFEGFRDFINLIDGIQVNVPEAIDDPTYPDECYGYDPFEIKPGLQSMNGPIALKYARTRATLNGDIDRAARQQAVLLAVRDKVIDVNMIPSLVTRSPQLWQTFQDNVKTSFTDTEVIQLALLVQEIPRDRIRMGVIDYNYVYNEVAPNGRQVLVPNYSAIRELREELFAPIAAPAPPLEDLQASVESEAADIVVLNGTQVFGLAASTRDFLLDHAINVVEIGNADAATYQTTQIIDYGSHTNTVRYLSRLMDLPPLNASQSTLARDYDILIILGADWELPQN
jgi:LCP family protein required for cell wall assembly